MAASNTFLHATSDKGGNPVTPEELDFIKKLAYPGMEYYSPTTGRKDKIDKIYTYMIRSKKGECVPWGDLALAYREGKPYGNYT